MARFCAGVGRLVFTRRRGCWSASMASPASQRLLRAVLVLQLACCCLVPVCAESASQISSLGLGRADRAPQDHSTLLGSSRGPLALVAGTNWQQEQLFVSAATRRPTVCWQLVSESKATSHQVKCWSVHSADIYTGTTCCDCVCHGQPGCWLD